MPDSSKSDYSIIHSPLTPLDIAFRVTEGESGYAFLHSGSQGNSSEGVSIIALRPEMIYEGENFSDFESILKNNLSNSTTIIGYIGYELKNSLEILPVDEESYIETPVFRLIQYSCLLELYPEKNEILVFTEDASLRQTVEKRINTEAKSANSLNAYDDDYFPGIKELHSNFTGKSYKDAVERVRQHIIRGDIYQANLTRKFTGRTTDIVDPLILHARLHDASPAPYSAVLKYEDFSVVSSSPELFLNIRGNNITTEPIKGSISAIPGNNQENANAKQILKNSTKDRAENLMITDLMRNDLGRFCNIGSIVVDDIFRVKSYPTIHHMSSVIKGVLKPGTTIADVVASTFPPGSMTGAPKIRAMKICSEMEKVKRGVYSGALGYISGSEKLSLSVVIRTILVSQNKFEFQVGGGIVYDSTPEGEWEETLVKARGLCSALGIDPARLRDL